MKRLVVSHYNENLDWLNDIDSSKIETYIVYHKLNNSNLSTYLDQEQLDSNNIALANIGREAHTYLFHIINNYHNLYDIEIFCQGNPFEHAFNFIETITNLDNDINFLQIGLFETIVDRDKIKESVCNFNFNYLNNLVEKDPNWTRANFFHIDSIYKDLFGEEMPKISYMKPYAQFAVSKKCIHTHSLDTYKRLFEYFNDNINYNVMAWHMEYFWHLLFRESQYLKYNSKNHIFNL